MNQVKETKRLSYLVGLCLSSTVAVTGLMMTYDAPLAAAAAVSEVSALTGTVSITETSNGASTPTFTFTDSSGNTYSSSDGQSVTSAVSELLSASSSTTGLSMTKDVSTDIKNLYHNSNAALAANTVVAASKTVNVTDSSSTSSGVSLTTSGASQLSTFNWDTNTVAGTVNLGTVNVTTATPSILTKVATNDVAGTISSLTVGEGASTVTVNNPSLAITNATVSSGTLAVDSGTVATLAVTSGGTTTVGSSSKVSTLDVSGGTATVASGTAVGTVEVSSGTANLSSGTTVSTLSVSGGTVAGSGATVGTVVLNSDTASISGVTATTVSLGSAVSEAAAAAVVSGTQASTVSVAADSTIDAETLAAAVKNVTVSKTTSDGTTTTAKVATDGTSTTTVTKTDGTATSTTKTSDGTTTVVSTDANGNTSTTVTDKNGNTTKVTAPGQTAMQDTLKAKFIDGKKGLEYFKNHDVNEMLKEIDAGSVNVTGYSQTGTLDDDSKALLRQAVIDAVRSEGVQFAAPINGAQQALAAVNGVAISNVASRTAMLRAEAITGKAGARSGEGSARVMAGSAQNSNDADNNVWFMIKHGDTTVKTSGYADSKVKYTNYQLGYDRKVQSNFFVGGYIGTTRGSIDTSGVSTDIDGGFEGGLYATQLLQQGQYLNYIGHYGKITNKYQGYSFDSKSTGMTVEYGKKLEQSKGLYLTPYIQFDYSKDSVDSVTINGNTLTTDDSNNFNMKLGATLEKMDNKGGSLYGGIAYGRGLSGKYASYVSGIALPEADNKRNIVYLNFGIKSMLDQTSYVDINLEKTLCDYNGWSAQAKFNWMF